MKHLLQNSYPEQNSFIVDLEKTHQLFNDFMNQNNLDCAYISSQDDFLSEYNVLANHQRYALSGFTGSTGDGIFISKSLKEALQLDAQFILFVDGRYHLQADQETLKKYVHVEKLTLTQSIRSSFFDWLKKLSINKISCGIDASRVSWQFNQSLQDFIKKLPEKHTVEPKLFLNNEFTKALKLPGWKTDRPIQALDSSKTGRTFEGNLEKILTNVSKTSAAENTCFVTCASDDAAWILNARAYHMPHTSSILAYTFLIDHHFYIFLSESTAKCKLNIETTSKFQVDIIRNDWNELESKFSKHKNIKNILFNQNSMNLQLPMFCKKIWSAAEFKSDFTTVQTLRAQKTEEELNCIRTAYIRSSKAIAETLRWVKSSVQLPRGSKTSDSLFQAPISELDLSNKIAREYQAQGAIELSFNTIAATGSTGAVIHYGAADKDRTIQPGDMTLLDSGAYYSDGFATDCTRVVFCKSHSKDPEDWQKQIYTTTLKACITGMQARLSKKDSCKTIDTKVRDVCKQSGFDYNHGTGHGIGIHVHEEGIRFSPASQYLGSENAVASIEPGIYLEGKGGVRIENAVILKTDPDQPDCFYFENLAYVGLDWDLIDINLLTSEEKAYLKSYEKKCRDLGTHIMDCPLNDI